MHFFSYDFIGDNVIKRISLKKISICLIAIAAIFLFYLFPTNDKLKINEELEYIEEGNVSTIFLMDSNNYLAKTSISLDDSDITSKAKKLLTALIQGEKYTEKIPNGFKSIIPNGTKILNIEYKDEVIKVDFSSELMDTNVDNEEKIIEAIVYTLTSIDNVKYVIIYMNGKILTKLPQSNITLPSALDRSFGINKEYNINSDKNITKTTVYYINKYNDKEYYVPVTKVSNDSREKVQIIIEELSNTSTYNANLMSYLNSNTKVVSLNEDENQLVIDFNDYIYNDIDSNEILDEVIYTICLSVQDNYNVDTVVFTVDNKEIYKSTSKILE